MSIPRRRNVPILALFLVLFVVSVGFGLVIPLLPLMARDFGASGFMLGSMTAGYAVVQFIFSPLWGQVSDRVGRKSVLMIGIAGLSLSFLAMGLAKTFLGLFAGRVMGGFLGSATLPAAQALAAELSSGSNRAKAMGVMGAAFGTGFIFGPLIGGALAPFGVAIPFFTSAALGFVTLALAAIALKEPDPGVRQRAGQKQADGKPNSVLRYIPQALAGPGAPFYLLALVIMFSQSSLMTALALYLTDRFGVGESAIGVVFALNGGVGALIQGAAIGPITARLGEMRAIRIGMTVGVLAYALLVSAPLFSLAVPAIVMTAVSMSLTRPSATSLLSQVTPLPQGITMGLQSSFDSLGRVVGPLWAGFAYDQTPTLPFLSAALAFGLFLLYLRRQAPAFQPQS